MIYRRYPTVFRRPMRMFPAVDNPVQANNIVDRQLEYIPFPNEADTRPFTPDVAENTENRKRPPSLLKTIGSRIHMDEIIILGLIFILMNEGVEDELLLIALVYLFISGFGRD